MIEGLRLLYRRLHREVHPVTATPCEQLLAEILQRMQQDDYEGTPEQQEVCPCSGSARQGLRSVAPLCLQRYCYYLLFEDISSPIECVLQEVLRVLAGAMGLPDPTEGDVFEAAYSIAEGKCMHALPVSQATPVTDPYGWPGCIQTREKCTACLSRLTRRTSRLFP